MKSCLCQGNSRGGWYKVPETGAKHLAIAMNSRCHSISLVMYIFGAKFEEHCSNISGDICDSVLFKWNYLHIQCHQNCSFA